VAKIFLISMITARGDGTEYDYHALGVMLPSNLNYKQFYCNLDSKQPASHVQGPIVLEEGLY